jgi:hypothetical protein
MKVLEAGIKRAKEIKYVCVYIYLPGDPHFLPEREAPRKDSRTHTCTHARTH